MVDEDKDEDHNNQHYICLHCIVHSTLTKIRRIFNVIIPLCDILKHRHLLKAEERKSERASTDVPLFRASVGHFADLDACLKQLSLLTWAVYFPPPHLDTTALAVHIFDVMMARLTSATPRQYVRVAAVPRSSIQMHESLSGGDTAASWQVVA